MKMGFLKILFLVIAAIIVGFMIFSYIVFKRDKNKTKEDIIKFIESKPQNCAMTVIRNGETIIDMNGEKLIPLASTVKIIYAIAFVRAVKEKFIDPNEKVPIESVDVFYFENTDGNAHKSWKREEKIGHEVTLKEIAQGMMKYSSNACTDYMYLRLGYERIAQVIKDFSISPHTDIYPMNSAMLIPAYFYQKSQMKRKEIAKTIKKMSDQRYCKLAQDMFQKIVNNEAKPLVDSLYIVSDMNIQREFTKKLPASSSRSYAELMYRLGERRVLSAEEKELLDEIMGFTDFKATGERLWYKGGSTAFVLTSAVFKSDKTESVTFSFFIEDMSRLDILWIKDLYKPFIKAFLEDEEFREEVVLTLETKGLTKWIAR
jgi:D-alanyl-D-alanine carboxypeptidase